MTTPFASRRSLDVVSHVVARDFRLRYRQSVFGWAWAIAQPLSRMLVLSLLFTRIVPLGIPNYGLYLFVGLIGWAWFSTAMASATSSAIDRRELLVHPRVPRGAVPVVCVLTAGLEYVAALPVLVVFLLLADGVPPATFILPLVMAVQVALTLGLGFALCAANVYVRDVRQLLDLGLTLGFYATPVFYAAEAVPERFRWAVELNPMARLLEAQRDVLLEGRLPSPVPFLIVSLVSLAALAAGYAVYRRASATFLDEL